MSKRYPRAKWPLPEIVNPVDHICFTVKVPNERAHIAAFVGNLYNLTKAMQWADDDDHTAKEVANVWKPLIEDVERQAENEDGSCGMSIQFRQSEECLLEVSTDGGATWDVVFNAQLCAFNTAKGLIDQMLEDGTLGGSQHPPDGDTPVGFCKTYHVTLLGNGRWLCPIPIKANYTIQISNAVGGANDGTIDDWRCPSGTAYILGECGSGTGGTEPTDPLPSLGHMRLIMRYDGTYRDAYNLTHTVSSSLIGSHDLEFQVNDDPLSDNSGSYQFDLQICNYGSCVPEFGIEPEFSTMTFADGIFTINAFAPRPDANNAYQGFVVVGDQNNNTCPCRKLEIVSLTGYTGPSDDNPFNGGAVYTCPGTVIVNEHGETVKNWQVFYNDLSETDQCIYQFDVKSVTAFTMQFRVVEC